MQKNTFPTSLVFKDTSCHIEGIPLFQPLSLTVNSGQCLLISGENGIGKTTLLRSIQGLSQDFSGQIKQSQNSIFIQSKRPFEAERTVLKNLQFWQSYYGKKNNFTLKMLLKDWYLTFLKDVPFKKLSEGQQQRLNLARLSLAHSDLWLLDEPFSFLDAKNCKLLWSHIENHLNNGGICCLVHHHFEIESLFSKNLKTRMVFKKLNHFPVFQKRVAL